MDNISAISEKPIFYISPDIRRALGLEGFLPNYYIICSIYEPLIELVRENGGHVYCLEEEIGNDAQKVSNSGQLLENNHVLQFIKEKSRGDQPNILYFKSNLKLDLLCRKFGFIKLVNNFDLNEQFENKINFFQFTKQFLPKYHLNGEIEILGKAIFAKLVEKITLPFVVQFGHGWAGKTTFIIKNKTDFLLLQQKFPETKIKVTPFKSGITVINNCAIFENKVLVGEPAIQLSGIRQLSTNPAITCGRQWPAIGLLKTQKQEIYQISQKVGQFMLQKGYKGYFGLDFLIDEKSGKIYLSEDNARFTASTPFYTKLELAQNKTPLFFYHLASFLDQQIGQDDLADNIIGSQVIVRNDKKEGIEIKNDIKPGHYKLVSGKITFVDHRYGVNRLNDKGFIIIPERKGKKIKKDEEIGRIELKQEVFESYGQLKKDIIQIIILIKRTD